MFSYRLPGDVKTVSFINAEGQIKFDPPVYEQRYMTAVRILEDERWSRHISKVVDFGCAEMRLLPLLRRIEHISCILEVDMDESLLQIHQQRAVPLVSDYLQKRENPLHVEVLKGSIDASVEKLRNVDAVVALEIIEHLYPITLDKVPQNIFGFMQPKLVICSTPNSDFNVLFGPLLANGFRHLDHKFEWSRAEFKKWALDICKCYSNYRVAIMGVGKPPPDKKQVGHVSQIAIFVRRDILGEPLEEPLTSGDMPVDTNPDVQYKEIYSIDFPFNRDERSKEQKILDESRYQIDRCRRVENYLNRERCIYQIPLKVLLSFTTSLGATDQEVRTVLKEHKIEVEDDFIIVPEYDEVDESYRLYDDCYDDEYHYNRDSEQDEDLAAGMTLAQINATEDSEENWD